MKAKLLEDLHHDLERFSKATNYDAGYLFEFVRKSTFFSVPVVIVKDSNGKEFGLRPQLVEIIDG